MNPRANNQAHPGGNNAPSQNPGVVSSGQQNIVKPKTNPNSTQNLPFEIAEIRDGIVIMNDGSFRSVVMVKALTLIL